MELVGIVVLVVVVVLDGGVMGYLFEEVEGVGGGRRYW